MFEFIARYFWAVAIGVTVVNFIVFKVRSDRHVRTNPELAEGYATLLRGYLIWMNLPWVVMGFGCVVGGVPTVWHYFRPQDRNPWVLAWSASIFLLWMLGSYWLFLRGGAERLVKYPGVLRGDISSPAVVKLVWLAALVGGVFGVAMMWNQNGPLPLSR